MEKLGESKVLFFSIILFIAAVPLAISNQFYSENDLLKSSAIFILGGLIIAYFCLVLIYRVIKGREKTFIYYHAGLLDLGVLALLIAVAVSTVFSLRPQISFWGTYERQLGLITYVYLTVLYFISGAVLNNSERRKTALQMIEIISVIISLYAILQFLNFDLFNFQPSWFERPGSFLGYCVFLGGFLALSLPFSVFNTAEKKNNLLKLLFPIVIILAIIVSGTRSAYMAVLVQFAVLVLFNKKFTMVFKPGTKTLVFIIAAAGLILLFLFMFVFKEGIVFHRIATAIDFDNPRLILWKDASNVFYKYPLTGPGIAMFPAALEEFYSNALRFREANVIMDHAHNNYLHILFTLGLTGLIAYILLIYYSFYSAIRIMKSKAVSKENRSISFASILMLTGYCVYGLTNFDDVSILFLFYILLSILRSLNLKKTEIGIKGLKTLIMIFSAAAIILSFINIPFTLNKLRADHYYKQAFVTYSKEDFKNALNLNNEAIKLNPDCSTYRFLEASEVVNYCVDNPKLEQKMKNDLLKQVEAELEKVKNNLYYVNYCNGILSLAYFEEGKNQEAENLMKEVLTRDSVNLNYRTVLARYFLKVNRLEEVKRSLDIITLMRPHEVISNLLSAMYYRKASDKEKAILYADEVIRVDPKNKIALEILSEFNKR